MQQQILEEVKRKSLTSYQTYFKPRKHESNHRYLSYEETLHEINEYRKRNLALYSRR